MKAFAVGRVILARMYEAPAQTLGWKRETFECPQKPIFGGYRKLILSPSIRGEGVLQPVKYGGCRRSWGAAGPRPRDHRERVTPPPPPCG